MKKGFYLFVLSSFITLFSCDTSNNSLNNTPATISSSTTLPIVSSSPVTSSVTDNSSDTSASNATFTVSTVPTLITQRCAYCHSIKPNPASGMSKAPSGITFDSQKEMENNASKIKQAVVTYKNMPLSPLKLSDAERDMIGQWCDSPNKDSQSVKTTPLPAVTSTPTPIPTVISTPSDAKMDVSTVPALISQKCAYCHSTTPNSASGYTTAPKGIKFDSDTDLNNNLNMIKQVVVIDKVMPIGSISLSDSERSMIGQWVDSKLSAANIKPVIKTRTATDVISEKCMYCHSAHPDASSGFKSAPRSITFDSEKEINDNIYKIYQVINDRSMPISTITISDSDRNIVKSWIDNQNLVNAPTLKTLAATDIIAQKCAYCHSANPDPSSGYTKAPKNLVLDTVQQMIDENEDINKMISNKKMPIGNITMTNQEKGIVITWCNEQEQLEDKNSVFGWLF